VADLQKCQQQPGVLGDEVGSGEGIEEREGDGGWSGSELGTRRKEGNGLFRDGEVAKEGFGSLASPSAIGGGGHSGTGAFQFRFRESAVF
jgi:hypothetical protein